VQELRIVKCITVINGVTAQPYTSISNHERSQSADVNLCLVGSSMKKF